MKVTRRITTDYLNQTIFAESFTTKPIRWRGSTSTPIRTRIIRPTRIKRTEIIRATIRTTTATRILRPRRIREQAILSFRTERSSRAFWKTTSPQNFAKQRPFQDDRPIAERVSRRGYRRLHFGREPFGKSFGTLANHVQF